MPEKKPAARKAGGKVPPEQTPGFALRIAISILVFFGLLASLVVWLFFYADSFTVFQNIAIVIVMILAAVAVLAAAWVSWGLKYGFDSECSHCGDSHGKR